MDAIVLRFIDKGVKAAKVIAADPDLKAPEKLFQIIMGQRAEEDGQKELMIEELHHVNNAEMHQKSLVESILQLTPVLTEVIEQGIQEGVFKRPYPKETVEFLLVSSQFLLDEGIFQWESQELKNKVMALTHLVETALGAQKGIFAYILDRYHNEKEEKSDESCRSDC